jgi:hypothetical protein
VAYKKRHENQKKHGRDKQVHPDRVQVACPSAPYIFLGKKTGFSKQVFYGSEEFTIKMGYVFNKMSQQMRKAFLWFKVFLPTGLTVAAYKMGATVKTYFFSAFV